MGISIWQLLILLAIVALVFGTSRLRNIGGDLGGAIQGFKKAMNNEDKNPPLEPPSESTETGSTQEDSTTKKPSE